MIFSPKPFKPASWLPNGHFQTVYASLFMKVPRPEYRREIIDLPDGDIIAADWVDGETEAPVVVLIHGMEGDSESRYARLLMNKCQRLGWTGVVLHMRSCGGLLNRKPQFYHAGFYQDILHFMDEIMPKRIGSRRLYVTGVSLGGSQLTHYLSHASPPENLKAACLISAPMDLRGSADFMKSGINRLYIYKFTRSLLKKYRAKAELIANPEFEQNLSKARNFWDLDDGATAPMHGFKGAEEYYQKMSAKNRMHEIKLPTLYLASKDDPFIPVESMPAAIGDLPSILTDRGGHVGFVNGGGRSWMVSTVFDFFKNY